MDSDRCFGSVRCNGHGRLQNGVLEDNLILPERRSLSSPAHRIYVHGVSTRSVDNLVKAMGASGVSKN